MKLVSPLYVIKSMLVHSYTFSCASWYTTVKLLACSHCFNSVTSVKLLFIIIWVAILSVPDILIPIWLWLYTSPNITVGNKSDIILGDVFVLNAALGISIASNWIDCLYVAGDIVDEFVSLFQFSLPFSTTSALRWW